MINLMKGEKADLPPAGDMYSHWELHEYLPAGFVVDKHTGSPLRGYDFATNGSPLKGGKRILVRAVEPKSINFPSSEKTKKIDIAQVVERKSSPKNITFDGAHVKTVNELARQKFKQKLLNDIMCDLMICEIEGWCKLEYIKELRDLICKIGSPICVERESVKKLSVKGGNQ